MMISACQQDTAGIQPAAKASPVQKATATEEVILEKRFLALGDSYTIGESVPPAERWPVILVRMLNEQDLMFLEPQIIARTGWTTGELATAMTESSLSPPYDLVSLLIGVNDQYRGYSPETYRLEFSRMLEAAQGLAGDRPGHVIVLSIPDWGATPFAARDNRGPQMITNEIAAFNRINLELTEQIGAIYIDIFPLSQLAGDDVTLLAHDLLHPSGKQYLAWAQAVLPAVLEIFR